MKISNGLKNIVFEWFDAKRSPKLTGEVLPYKDNMFIVKWRDRSMDANAFIMFSKSGSGKVGGMAMKAISPLTDFSYDFHDLESNPVFSPDGSMIAFTGQYNGNTDVFVVPVSGGVPKRLT